MATNVSLGDGRFAIQFVIRSLVISTGRRNSCVKHIGWCLPAEGLAWTAVEFPRHRVELSLCHKPLLTMPYYLSPGWLRIDPTFTPLRGNPRFERMVAGR
jgi:hypothetical protein